ncbi:MAG: hypothetical protein FJ102_18865 [Deltaproteobacteria bacterium]|nr:hypothetical protein [Deltaproteobacteria bacterium]
MASDDDFAWLDEALAAIGDLSPRVIGGQALTAYGLPRSTIDVDLLVGTRAALRRAWMGKPPEVREASDASDPLDGVVEWWPGEGDSRVPVQVLVLERAWLAPLLNEPGVPVSIGGRSLTAVAPPLFVALKLYAGGPRDRADLELLATHPEWGRWRERFEAILPTLPPTIRRRWARWRPGELADDD